MTCVRPALAIGLAALLCVPAPAHAFSTRIHIMIANKVREALVDGGTGSVPLKLGEWSVTFAPADVEAISDYPLAFRAGAVGPDNMVFPGMTDPSHAIGQRPFEQCELLYQAAELPEERAYALGCFLHGSTDAVAHHYVNYMAGETFTLTPLTSSRASSLDNVVRHILAESQLQAAAIDQDPGAFEGSKLLHAIPIGFVLRAYLDTDSPLWQMMALHAKAEYDQVVADNPGATLPTIVAAMDVGPADHLVLSPVYLQSVDDLIVQKRLEIETRILGMQDWNTADGGKLKVTSGKDGVLGTKDDKTDCSATCPQLFATYFTFVGLLAPRYNAQNQPLPSAFDKVSEELRGELFQFTEAYMEVVANVSAKLNEAPNGMNGEFGLHKEDLKALFQPLNDWADKLTTIDYDTLVYATIPDWIIELDTFMQAFGVDFDISAIIKAVFDPLIQPIKDAIQKAFIEQAQVFIEQLVAEIDAKKEPIYNEYTARLAAAADPAMDGTMLDHFYDSGLFNHAFNIAAAGIADHKLILPVGDDPIGVGPASFDASYTPAWMQAGACDYLATAIFPLGIDLRAAISVRDAVDYPAQVDDDSPIECHDGSLMAFTASPNAATCTLVKIAALLGMPVGSLTRAYPPDLDHQPATCLGLDIPGLPAPPPDPGTDTEGDSDSDSGGSGETASDPTDTTPTSDSDTPTGGGPTAATATDTTGANTDTAGGDGDASDEGCACRSSDPKAPGLGLGLLGLLGLGRRRRRRAATLALSATLGLGACGDDGAGATDMATTTATTSAGTTTPDPTTGDTTIDLPATTSDDTDDTTTTDHTSDTSSTTDLDPTTGDDTTTTDDTTGGSQAGELLAALNGTVWRGEQTRGDKTRAYELRFDSDSLLWSELRNPFGPARSREMRAFKVEADGLTAHSTVIQPQGWPVNPENGRKDDWTLELIDGDPRVLRTTRGGLTEDFIEGSYDAPTDGLTAIVRVFKVGGAVDKALCDSGASGFKYPTLFDFARGKSDEIVATDVVAGARLLTWSDPSNNNQFSINDIDGFDRLGGTELSDTFNFFVTYTGKIAHPGGTLAMREGNDSVEDAVWVFLNDKVGVGGKDDLFLEVHGFVWADNTPDEPKADFGAGDLPIEAIVVRCTEAIKNVDVEIRLNGQWSLVGNVASTPPIDPKLFPPAL